MASTSFWPPTIFWPSALFQHPLFYGLHFALAPTLFGPPTMVLPLIFSALYFCLATHPISASHPVSASTFPGVYFPPSSHPVSVSHSFLASTFFWPLFPFQPSILASRSFSAPSFIQAFMRSLHFRHFVAHRALFVSLAPFGTPQFSAPYLPFGLSPIFGLHSFVPSVSPRDSWHQRPRVQR